MTKPLNIVVGVGGGIAAYKIPALIRLFTEQGHSVRVVPTRSALKFVGAPTWEALSGSPVTAEVWDNVAEVPHVAIGQNADLVIVAPATADFMARVCAGMADDLLTNVLLTTTAPVVVVPAMHTEMWENAATQSNVRTLRERGYIVVEPAEGRLTGADTGKGRMPEPDAIAALALLQVSSDVQDMTGLQVVVSAGGTREYIDPVRFLGNRSSGKQGIALAADALRRGAQVTLVLANVSLPTPAGVEVVRVDTTEQLREAMIAQSHDADVIVMAAAVADYAPVHVSSTKMKKSEDGQSPTIELRRTPDILAELVALQTATHPDQTIVGFAAETGDDVADVLAHGAAKLARKGCDLLVVNEVGHEGNTGTGFGTDDNQVTILFADGREGVHVPTASKSDIAHAVLSQVLSLRNTHTA